MEDCCGRGCEVSTGTTLFRIGAGQRGGDRGDSFDGEDVERKENCRKSWPATGPAVIYGLVSFSMPWLFEGFLLKHLNAQFCRESDSLDLNQALDPSQAFP